MATKRFLAPMSIVTLDPTALTRAPNILQTFPDVTTLTSLSTALTGYGLELDKELIANPGRSNAKRLREVSDLLILQAVLIKAEAMGLLGDQAGQAVADLKEVTVQVNQVLLTIKQVKKALQIGVALLGVVSAFTAGAVGPAVASLAKLKKALNTA